MNSKKILFISFFLFLSITQTVSSQNIPLSKHFKIHKLAEGIYAAIASDSGYAICNAGIIDLGNKTLVFDTFINPGAAEDLLAAARELTKHKVDFVVNSHYHDDHIRGNQVFPEETDIISTVWTRNEIEKVEPESIQWAKKNIANLINKIQENYEDESDESARKKIFARLNYLHSIESSLPVLKTRLPNITIDDTMKIIGEKSTAVLIPMGKGHTQSDIILYLPEEKIIFTGDLLFKQMHPWLADGYPNEWKKDLRNIDRLDPRILVPGHGQIANLSDLSIMSTYIQSLQDLVKELIKEDESIEDIEDNPIPDEYKNWGLSRFFYDNVKFLYDLEKKYIQN